MSETAIRVENLSKLYHIGQRERYKTLRDRLTDVMYAPFRRIRSTFQRSNTQPANGNNTIWALKDVSFEVKHGEVIGIIGRNGAGKSTLLKILSRITEPTEGHAEINGRVGSLLEVGTGFHPELTGRENIYLNGTILGMRKAEIDRKFDEIVDFAEIEKFLDTPVKHYSSGMYVRLAFAVAAHLEPEILLVDEVLSVGDAGFQKKCLGKMEGVARQGRTVLFVSHQMGQIVTLCPRCLMIQQGHIAIDGTTQTVIDAYIASLLEVQATGLRDRKDRKGTGQVRIVDTWVENENGDRVQHVLSGSRVKLVAQYEVADGSKLTNVLFGFGIMNSYGLWITDVGSHSVGMSFVVGPKPGRVECVIPKLSLNAGVFTCNVIVRSGNSGFEIFDYIQNANRFSVEPGDYYGTGVIQGSGFILVMDYDWRIVDDEISRVEQEAQSEIWRN